MLIEAGRIRFSTPPGLTDATGYVFQARKDKERCEVTAERLPSGVSDVDALAGYRRQVLLEGMPDSVIEGRGMSALAGLPARTLTFSFGDYAGTYRGRIGLALDTPETYVQVVYLARGDNPLAGARFEHALDSASLAPVVFPTPEGSTRRWAGKLWLDLPSHLEPPRTYVFLSPDEATRFEVAVVDLDTEPGIEKEVEADLSFGGTVGDRTAAEIATPHLTGTLHGYTVTRAEGGVLLQDVVRRAHLRHGDFPVAHVFGRGPSIDAGPLEATFDALVNSVEETGALMLKIYPEQMEAFSAASMRDFERRMEGHLRRFYAEDCRILGEEGVREVVRHGIARAGGYGIVGEHDLGLYLNLVMALGRDFDRDPLLPWARAVLVDESLPEPSRRMARLYRHTLERTRTPLPGDDDYE